ncbi:Metalloprotease PmbA [Aquicella siphonis]|uniref:Metalloprotease PmbA n=1 Tax=Aquicella siphonis TaxID=254247 RepID=A0A5E4PHX2_9COXI|nr:metalloprotease PmbA [Aquicella siphonis]VVC76128.1 Metalloprotease PmbA [Aquicella siphonis]
MNEMIKSLIDSSQLQAITRDVLQEAKNKGASQSELNISLNKGFRVTARDGDVERVEYHQDKVLELTVYFGRRSGSASVSDLRPESVHAAVDAACHIARFTDEDPAAGLADRKDLALDFPRLDLAYPWEVTVDKAIEMACQCEREALAYDNRIVSAEETSVATMDAFHLYANSNGFMGSYPYTRHEISCVLIGKQDDEMQRDYSYTVASDPASLVSVSDIAKQAAERTVRRLGARRLPTMKTPVIYLAEEARGLLGHFIAAISGGSLYRKSSFLLDHLGKKIFPSFMHIQEQPHLARGLGSAPFDEDGLATRPNVFIEDGVLKQYCLSVYTGRKLGMQSTANAGGVHNLIVKTGNHDLTSLLKTMGKGLLITEMMGNGANLVTGDYSRGAGGYWVEEGEIQYPVQEITVAGKLQNMYAGIREVGSDVDVRGNIRTGSILIEEMMVAGS